MTSQSILASNGIPKQKGEYNDSLIKSNRFYSSNGFNDFAVPTETASQTCEAEISVKQECSETIVASADVKKKKKKGKRLEDQKAKNPRRVFSLRFLVLSNLTS